MSNNSVKNDNELKKQIISALRPIDDAFMRAMFKDDIPLFQLVPGIILDKNDLTVTEIETQRDLSNQITRNNRADYKRVSRKELSIEAYHTEKLKLKRSKSEAGKPRFFIWLAQLIW